MRRYLAHWPQEVPRIYSHDGVDFSWVPHGHGPVQLLMSTAAEIRFVGDGAQQGWILSEVSPLRKLGGPIHHFSEC